MAKTKPSTEEIIEKKESTPVASASLILSFVAMLAAIVFCVLEVMDYRKAPLASGDTPGMATAKADLAKLTRGVEGVLNDQALPDDEEEDEGEDEEEDEEDLDDEEADEEDLDEEADEEDSEEEEAEPSEEEEAEPSEEEEAEPSEEEEADEDF